jgi:hypothetical protein
VNRCGVPVRTPHSSDFARLASEAFYAAIVLADFYEIIIIGNETSGRDSQAF